MLLFCFYILSFMSAEYRQLWVETSYTPIVFSDLFVFSSHTLLLSGD